MVGRGLNVALETGAVLLRDGTRIADGAVGEVLSRAQLEALYQAPVDTLTDTASAKTAFLPG